MLSSFPRRCSLGPRQRPNDALRCAYRFGPGEPGREHTLIAILGRGEGGASELVRALGVDPNSIRFETKNRAWPSSVAAGSNELRGTSRKIVDEPDFGAE
jgi:hypothetical protein